MKLYHYYSELYNTHARAHPHFKYVVYSNSFISHTNTLAAHRWWNETIFNILWINYYLNHRPSAHIWRHTTTYTSNQPHFPMHLHFQAESSFDQKLFNQFVCYFVSNPNSRINSRGFEFILRCRRMQIQFYMHVHCIITFSQMHRIAIEYIQCSVNLNRIDTDFLLDWIDCMFVTFYPSMVFKSISVFGRTQWK